ncbi:hypothetical protein [Draconibacterium orientale]|uniref:hypothetical protein n=1 Tax=Draconibacterium orientale TaxID=1168034 RepID=UPI0029BFFC36|nr:hypothetical protein [Draconibacterium orientale]
MDLKKIKAQITSLENKLTKEEEKYFIQYYIDDILDSREYELINNPITDFDWFIYWTDIKEDLSTIFSLFFQKEKLNSTEYSVLCECVGLKKLIDSKITNLPKWKEYESIDIIDYFESKRIPPYTLSDRTSTRSINNLLDFLISQELIEPISLKDFKNHFEIDESDTAPIIWKKDAIRLAAFINSLYNLNLIEIKGEYKDKKWELAKLHFKKSDQTPFDTNMLSNRSSQKNYNKYYKFFEAKLKPLLE